MYWESFFKDLVDAIENKDLDKIKEITSYEVWNYPINNVYDPETPKLSKLANRVIQERINWYISHRDYLDNEIFKDKEIPTIIKGISKSAKLNKPYCGYLFEYL